MKKTKRIVVFANSYKGQERCIAGKDQSSYKWIRPVTNEASGPIPYDRARMINPYGEYLIKKLSVIDIPLVREVPLLNQPENFLLDDGKINQHYNINFEEIPEYIDKPELLWENGFSTRYGLNDKVQFEKISTGILKVNQSLYLIEVDYLRIIEDCSTYGRERGRKRGLFSYNSQEYNMAITDPFLYREFSELNINEMIISGPLYICLSLGDVYKDGFCHKLIAGIHYKNLSIE